ncbi:MAG TPA: SDR family oxidoreductase [Ilumatobacter sp.]
MQISDSTWVVTGASVGIGEAIAAEAAARGATVIGIARRGDVLGAAMERIGGSPLVADLADPEAVVGLVERIEAEHGPIDVWVNNAGVEVVGALREATADHVRMIHQVNLLAPIELCRQVIPLMERRGGGHVVNVSSMASSAGFSGMSLYCSTKAGLSNFHRVLRAEMKGSPVATTVVEIGPIPTAMLERVYGHPPTERGFRRLRRLQLMPEVPREVVARGVVEAVAKGRRTVRYPRRAMLFPLITSTPQRVVDVLLVGRRRPVVNPL